VIRTQWSYRDRVATHVTGPIGQLAERYLRAVAVEDWSTVAESVSSDVVRQGPFGDDVEGIGPYLDFLKRTMPSLPGYRMDIDRVTDLGDQRAMVELRETIVVDAAPLETYECLVFDAGPDGRLTKISIYIRQSKPG
jgi:predicted ester cyclase